MVVVILGLVMLFFTAGCARAPERTHVKDAFARDLPRACFRHRVSITLGAASVGLARIVTGLAPGASEAHEYLRDISRIQLAIYDVQGFAAKRIRQEFAGEGWVTAVRVRNPGKIVWVMYRIANEETREVYAVIFRNDQIVIIKARGHFNRMAARVLDNHRNLVWPALRHRADGRLRFQTGNPLRHPAMTPPAQPAGESVQAPRSRSAMPR